ncbi:hypothetical protein DFJ74DRAFT_400297 [Hyaloraphidium curvatum]|nr:hypothetical protein DFJ74DRAFT_400297 [Hyaloraphidium curvatum]
MGQPAALDGLLRDEARRRRPRKRRLPPLRKRRRPPASATPTTAFPCAPTATAYAVPPPYSALGLQQCDSSQNWLACNSANGASISGETSSNGLCFPDAPSGYCCASMQGLYHMGYCAGKKICTRSGVMGFHDDDPKNTYCDPATGEVTGTSNAGQTGLCDSTAGAYYWLGCCGAYSP